MPLAFARVSRLVGLPEFRAEAIRKKGWIAGSGAEGIHEAILDIVKPCRD
jgi:hypothetical protein